MRLVTYAEVLKGVCDRMGWEVDASGDPNLDDKQWHAAKRAISRALRIFWRAAAWPDLNRVEERQFWAVYDASESVAAGTFRYFPPTGNYYQALKASTGQGPALEDPVGTWTTNTAYWALASRALSADNYDSTATYDVGDTVYYPSGNSFHQLHTAASAGTAPTNTSYWGEITALDPCIPWAQEGKLAIDRVIAMSLYDPATYRGPRPLQWRETNNGVQVLDHTVNSVWLRYALRPPRFQGDVWDATATYSVDSEESSGTISVPVTSNSTQLALAGVAALRALTTHVSMQIVWLSYLDTPGDDQGGRFEYDAASTDADDSVDTIKPTDVSGAGRWKRTTSL